MKRAAAALVLLVACGSKQPPAPTAAAPSAKPALSAAPAASASAAASADGDDDDAGSETEPAAPPIAWDGPAACTLRASSPFVQSRAWPLLIDVKGAPPFAKAHFAAGAVSLPDSDHGTLALVDADVAPRADRAHGPHLRALVDARVVELLPQRPFAFGGVLFPKPHAMLEYIGSSSGHVEVALELQDLGLREGGQHPRVEVSCGDVGLAMAEMEMPWDSATASPDAGAPMLAAPKKASTLAFAPTADGRPTADMDVQPSTEMRILEAKGTRLRVVVDLGDDPAYLVGWIDAAAVDKKPAGLTGRGEGIGLGTGRGRGGPKHLVTCSRAIPLEVTERGVRRTVGTIPAGTVVGIVQTGSQRTQVAFPVANVEATPDALFLVDHAALAGCTEKDSQ